MRWSPVEDQKFINFFSKNMKKNLKKNLTAWGGVIYLKQDFGKTKLLQK